MIQLIVTTRRVINTFEVIFSYPINIYLWHESEDINQKKTVFPKFQLIPILSLQFMYGYGVFHCSIDDSVELSLVDKNLCENYVFRTKMVSAFKLKLKFLWGNVLLRGELYVTEKNQIVKKLRSPSVWNHWVYLWAKKIQILTVIITTNKFKSHTRLLAQCKPWMNSHKFCLNSWSKLDQMRTECFSITLCYLKYNQ